MDYSASQSYPVNRWLALLVVVLGVLFIGAQQALAQQPADTLDMEALRKQMYLYYSNRNAEQFFLTTGRIKRLAKRQNNEKDYYKAYGNEIIFTSFSSRARAIEMSKELIRSAEQADSKYGLYTANYTLGTIYTSLGQLAEARDHYKDALEILTEDYPDESRSPLLLALCRVDKALGNYRQVAEYTDYVLADNDARLQHKLSAWTYKYLILTGLNATIEERDSVYAEREKMKQRLGHDDNFKFSVEFEHALAHEDFQKAERLIEETPTISKATRLVSYARLCRLRGDYKEAYDYLNAYRKVSDSISNEQVRKGSLDIGATLDKVRAESEAKDLRLENQALEMQRIASELERKRMQEQALAMAAEYQQSRLHEMEALRESDSLMAYNKELQLSEYRSQMEAFENAERTRRMKWIAFGVLSVMGFIFMVVYGFIRVRQLRRLREAYDKLEETTAAKERIESELRIARDIQMAMVPHFYPNTPRLDLYASMVPAKEVGGDLYDYVLTAEGHHLYFCLGDVSGKGVPAALFMAMSARLFRTLCKYELAPAEIATAMNNELALNNDNGMFVTMFIGLLDLNSGHLAFCNAGHNPPILDGEFMDVEPNAPLGLWEGLDYEGQAVDSIRGKQLFIYSDGLNEAENADKDQYGDDRLLAFVREHMGMGAHELIDLLKEDLETHVNGANPSDDLTMLCMRKK